MWLQAVLLKTLFLTIYSEKNTYLKMSDNSQYINEKYRGIAEGIPLPNRWELVLLDDIFDIMSLATIGNFDKMPIELNPNKEFSGVTIKGIVRSNPERFSVELMDMLANIGFHISFMYKEGKTVLSAREVIRKYWDKPDIYDELAIQPGDEFELIISRTEDSYKIDVNDKSYLYKLKKRTLETSELLRIKGDVMITSINWNGWQKTTFNIRKRIRDSDELIDPYEGLREITNVDKIPKRIDLTKSFPSVTIKGIIASNAERMQVEMMDATGANDLMYIMFLFMEGTTILNSDGPATGNHEDEEYKELAIKPGDEFTIIISTTEDSFKVEVNEKLYLFKYRAPVENVKFAVVAGDVATTSVQWDGLSD